MKNTKASIITIGDEILIGQITDTNSQWLASHLNEIGVQVNQILTIPDLDVVIKKTLDAELERSDIIIITGGLGPTKDDLTKHALVDYFKTRLVRDEEIFTLLKNYYKSKGKQLNDLNATQADLPENCKILKNKIGTASGMLFESDGNIIISMPGVPREMKYIMEQHVFEIIKETYDIEPIYHKTILTVGIAESNLAMLLDDWQTNLPSSIKIAYLPTLGRVRIRLSVFGKRLIDAEKITSKHVKELYLILGHLIFGEGEITLQQKIASILSANRKTLATSESCTGGNISRLLTEIPGSSFFFKGSIVAYSNELKQNLLNVQKKVLDEFGAVSEEVIIQMASNLRENLKTDYAIATSGIAGPDGGSSKKPIGTTWIACASKEGVQTKLLHLSNERLANIELASISALDLLRRTLLQNEVNK